MPLSQNILAEQNVYARLVVSRIKPTLTAFQSATIENSVSTRPFYSYYGNDTNVPALTSFVNPDIYSITSLPDTVAYLPRNSIFDHLMLITSNDQDYRKLLVTSKFDTFDMSNGPTIAGSNAPSIYTPSTTQAIYQINQPITTQLFTSIPPEFAVTPTQKRFADIANVTLADPRFDNITAANIWTKFGSMNLDIMTIINGNNSNDTSAGDRTSYSPETVLQSMGISDDIIAYVKTQTDISAVKKNSSVIKAYIVLQSIPDNGASLTAAELKNLVSIIDTCVDRYTPNQTTDTTATTATVSTDVQMS